MGSQLNFQGYFSFLPKVHSTSVTVNLHENTHANPLVWYQYTSNKAYLYIFQIRCQNSVGLTFNMFSKLTVLAFASQLFLPTIVRFLVLTAPQSPLQEENLDQLVNWQSSWQGIWQGWVRAGTGPAYQRHSWMPACPPSCFRQVIAKGKAYRAV